MIPGRTHYTAGTVGLLEHLQQVRRRREDDAAGPGARDNHESSQTGGAVREQQAVSTRPPSPPQHERSDGIASRARTLRSARDRGGGGGGARVDLSAIRDQVRESAHQLPADATTPPPLPAQDGPSSPTPSRGLSRRASHLSEKLGGDDRGGGEYVVPGRRSPSPRRRSSSPPRRRRWASAKSPGQTLLHRVQDMVVSRTRRSPERFASSRAGFDGPAGSTATSPTRLDPRPPLPRPIVADLSDGWSQVLPTDGVSQPYYWNPALDRVQWHPPGTAVSSSSASGLVSRRVDDSAGHSPRYGHASVAAALLSGGPARGMGGGAPPQPSLAPWRHGRAKSSSPRRQRRLLGGATALSSPQRCDAPFIAVVAVVAVVAAAAAAAGVEVGGRWR
jgi:hypothetical protein